MILNRFLFKVDHQENCAVDHENMHETVHDMGDEIRE